MSNNALVIPIVLPMITGVLALLLQRRVVWQRVLSVISTTVGLIVAFSLAGLVHREGIQTLFVGNFPAPFSIVLVADLFGTLMVCLAYLVALVILFYSFLTLDAERESYYYYAFYQFLIMGLSGSFLTGDLFNLFVWFEVMLISSYILLILGGERLQLQEGFKYVIINVLASALFLVAVGAVYQSFGTLNMADLAQKIAETPSSGLVTTLALLFIVVFGTKAAVFPLYFWLPGSYDTPPAAVSALFAGILTKVGVYALVRIFTLIFLQQTSVTHTVLLWVAGLTLVIGVLGALTQQDLRTILSYHVVGHIGYMVMGLAIFTPLALAGTLYYLIHDVVVKAGLYLLSGVVEKAYGTRDLRQVRGIMTAYPVLAGLFLVGGLSLAGVPPFSGFFGKFLLIQAGFTAGRWGISTIAVLVSLLILYSVVQIFRTAFWGEYSVGDKRDEVVPAFDGRLLAPVGSLILLTVVLGLGTQYFASFAMESANQLLHPSLYLQAVLGP